MKVNLPDGSVLELETPEEIEQYMILTGQKVEKTQAQQLREQMSAMARAAAPVVSGMAAQAELAPAVGGPVAPLAPPPPRNPLTVRKITDLGLPQLTANILARTGIHTVGDLVRYTPNQLRGLRSFTELNLAHVRNALKQHNLTLATDEVVEVNPARPDVVQTKPRVYFYSANEKPLIDVLMVYREGLSVHDIAVLLDRPDTPISRAITKMERQGRIIRKVPGHWRYTLAEDAYDAKFEEAYYPHTRQREWDFENGY